MTRTVLVGLMMVAVMVSAPACKGCGGGDEPAPPAPQGDAGAKPDAEPAPMPDKPET